MEKRYSHLILAVVAAIAALAGGLGSVRAADEGVLVIDESFEGGGNQTFVRRVGPPAVLVRPMHKGATEHVLTLGVPGKPGALVTVGLREINLSDFRIEMELTRAHIAILGENWRLACNAVGEMNDWSFDVGLIHDHSTPASRLIRIGEGTGRVATSGMHRLIIEKIGRRMTVTLDGSVREISQPIPPGHLSPGVIGLDIAGYGEDWQLRSFRLWNLAGVDHERPLDLRMNHYPSLGKLYVFPILAADDAFTLLIRDAAGAERFRTGVTLTATDRRRGLVLDIPKLEAGTYTLVAATVSDDGELVERQTSELVREGFVWEGNNLGLSQTIYPPFAPIIVADGTVEVVMRKHRVGGLGLWDSVQARGNESDYRELLAAPMRLVANGEPLVGSGRIAAANDREVVFQGKATTAAVTVETRATTEVDGCLKVELTLLPPENRDQRSEVGGQNETLNPEPLQSLWLDIPLADALMPLWHVANAGLRSNPAGRTPAGDGLIWRSLGHSIALNRPTPGWLNDFLPYVWLGAEERGLAWFADNDTGWILDPAVAALELYRLEGVLTLRVNLVQKPTVIDQPRTIIFGLMASPTKPMPENWRHILAGNMWSYAGRVPGYRKYDWMGSQYWGSDNHFAAKYPVNKDFSILDKMQEAALAKRANLEPFRTTWAARNLGDAFPAGGNRSREQIYSLIRVSLDWASRVPGDMTVYWEEFVAVCRSHRELKTFGWEWTGGQGKGIRPNISRSYQDFACWFGAEFLRRGIGLYFDNTFMELAYDPVTTSAYYWDNDNVQPSAGIWARRDYLRRIWTLHRQLPPAYAQPRMMLHMTNAQILPYMVWNDVNLDLEWRDQTLPRQAAFSPELLRAESLGLQTGNIPEALSMKNVRSDLSFFGAMMVHEMRGWFLHPRARVMLQKMLEFGYGRDGCAVINYWADKPPLTLDDPLCKWLLLKRDDRLLLLLCTWNADDAEVAIAFDPALLGFSVRHAADAEGDEPLTMQADGVLRLPLPRYGTRLVSLTGDLKGAK